jgi:epoxyqueuosine reductase QueG
VRTADTSWSSRSDLNLQSLIELWRRSDTELAAFIGDTAMTRAGVRGLRRNLAVALGNSGDRCALDALNEDRSDETIRDALVVEHAEWAKQKLTATTRTRG